MDTFFESLRFKNKVRVHFTHLMMDVHSGQNQYLRVPETVLCCDEFQVVDVADAMILRKVFSEIFLKRFVLILTSNRKPDDLYKDGRNRQNFLPCIEMIKRHCNIFNLDSGTDYRKISKELLKYFLYAALNQVH